LSPCFLKKARRGTLWLSSKPKQYELMKSSSLVANLRLLAETFLIFIFILSLGVLPRSLSLKVGEFLGLCLFFSIRGRRRIALKNIEIARKGGLKLPFSPERIVRMHFINLGRSISELSMLSLGKTSIMKDIVFEGIEHYNNAKAKGQGVILITGHCGNWELLSLGISWKGLTTSGVARTLDNPYLNKFMEYLRTKFGNKVIYKTGALKKIFAALKKGESAGILIDQSVVENEAVVTEFFGEKVYAMKIPALLARKTGAAVVPLFINYLGQGRHRIRFNEEIPLRITDNTEDDILFNTRIFTEQIEKYIKEHPSEWLWIHRRWKLTLGRKY
ncbi:MAG: lysophospholipid acyltransferase family protein, partial [Candidatus Scalindua sp.]